MTKTTNTPAIAADITADGTALVLTFAHGESLTIKPAELSPTIVAQAVMHGLKQKLVDAAAISRNPETGRAASVADKFDAVKEVYDRLLSGEWNKRRESGAGSLGGGLLFRALCRMYAGKKDADAIREFLDAKTDAEKAALRKNAKVAAIIEEIRAESAKPGDANTDDLLADLEG
jgi:hypothetical protein